MNANAMLEQFAKGAAKEAPQYTEIRREDVAGLQKIVALLTSFDEKTGRYTPYNDPETHYARVALAKVTEENARFFIKDLGGFVYSVIGVIEGKSCILATAWVHAKEAPQYTEIRREDVEGHPVHSIECMTDFCERSAKVHADHIPGIVLNLMEERV